MNSRTPPLARRFRVATWNVLHRIHAVNWGEDPIAHHHDESARLDAIARRVADELASGSLAVALQEASGDLLAAVRRAVPRDVVVFDHKLARMPKLRGREALDPGRSLADPAEHLVVATSTRAARPVAGVTYESDQGKGFLAVDLGDHVTLVCTHVSYAGRGDRQLAELGAWARKRAGAGAVVVVGDFNTEAGAVRRALGRDAGISACEKPSRVARAGGVGCVIDHVVVLRGAVEHAEVVDAEGLSDHNLVRAVVAV